MSEPIALDPSFPRQPVAGPAARLAAAAVGIVVLLLGGLVSAGTVLLAPLGSWLARRYLRRTRLLGPGGRWLASTVTVALAGAAVAGLVTASLPAGSLQKIRAASDSAAAATPRQKTPAWVERIAPGTTAAADRPSRIPAGFQSAFMLWSGAMGAVILAALLGTIGWIGGLLLSYARHGRWPSATPPPLGMGAA